MLSELRTRKLTRFFNVLDRDGDGVLTPADPEQVAQSLASLRGLERGSEEHESFYDAFMFYWNDFMTTADEDGDGMVLLDEWLEHYAKTLEDEAAFEQWAATSAELMFGLMDADGDGKISLKEYAQWMEAWGVDGDGGGEASFEKLDRGAGTLCKDEVIELTREFFYSEDPDAPGNWTMGSF